MAALAGKFGERPCNGSGLTDAPVFWYGHWSGERECTTYEEFEHIILSACYSAAFFKDLQSPVRDKIKMAKFIVNGETRNSLNLKKQIAKLKDTINSPSAKEEVSWAMFNALCQLKKENGLIISGGKEIKKYVELLDAILSALHDQLHKRNTPKKHEEYQVANLWLPGGVMRERNKHPHQIDGLIYQLAYLVTDWNSGKKMAFGLGFGLKPVIGEQYYPEIIAQLVNATLPQLPAVTAGKVRERINYLKRCKAEILEWPPPTNLQN